MASLEGARGLLLVALILARTMPMLVLTPYLAGKLVPATVKMGLGVLLTILVWPIAVGTIDMYRGVDAV